MFVFDTRLRVRYGETDQMGYVYYGNYAEYFEVGRVEALRELGFSYAKLEQEGVLLPVLEYTIKYIKPAKYDDELIIRTTIASLKGPRIHFTYEVLSATEELLTIAETTLVFMSGETKRPCRPPEALQQRLAEIS